MQGVALRDGRVNGALEVANVRALVRAGLAGEGGGRGRGGKEEGSDGLCVSLNPGVIKRGEHTLVKSMASFGRDEQRSDEVRAKDRLPGGFMYLRRDWTGLKECRPCRSHNTNVQVRKRTI